MPHKRAKRSVREQSRNEQGSDLVPSKQNLSDEPIPKSVSRVLNASSIRELHKNKRKIDDQDVGSDRKKRRKREDAPSKEANSISQLKIKAGESIQHFHRRVEDDMRPLVRSAMQTSRAVIRNSHKTELAEHTTKRKLREPKPSHESVKAKPRSSPSPPPKPERTGPTEFKSHSSSTPKRLNDIAQAPPELKVLSRKVSQSAPSAKQFGSRDVLSLAQQVQIAEERDKVIARYRELKAKRNEGIRPS